jgi:hypothetical protein
MAEPAGLHGTHGQGGGGMSGVEGSPVEALRRWEAMGAVWRVTSRTTSQLTISLLRCDGGEEVETFVSSDSDLLEFVGDRSASDL